MLARLVDYAVVKVESPMPPLPVLKEHCHADVTVRQMRSQLDRLSEAFLRLVKVFTDAQAFTERSHRPPIVRRQFQRALHPYTRYWQVRQLVQLNAP